MKKIILGVFCCLLVSVIATGCTYKTNYIKNATMNCISFLEILVMII